MFADGKCTCRHSPKTQQPLIRAVFSLTLPGQPGASLSSHMKIGEQMAIGVVKLLPPVDLHLKGIHPHS